jgi:hypothetical protein
MEDRSAGVLCRRAVEWLSHVDRIVSEPACSNRDDCQNELFFGIQRNEHLIGRDSDRVAALHTTFDL